MVRTILKEHLAKRTRITSVLLFGILLPFFSLYSFSTAAEIIFEGYAKINAGSKHVGFFVQRYEFDAKKKQFSSTYFIKTSPAGGDITESLKAVANDKFQPISYQYTSKIGDALKVVDAKFKGRTMTFNVADGKTKNTFTRQIPEGAFLVTFLQYMMLQNGYQVGKKFNYTAISEEDGEVRAGEALIKEEMDFKDVKGYRVLYEFNNAKFIGFVSTKGEVLGTVSPVQDISTELVSSMAEATTGMMISNKTLQLIFGNVPEGKINAVAKANLAAPTNKPNALPNTKTEPPVPAPATNKSPSEKASPNKPSGP